MSDEEKNESNSQENNQEASQNNIWDRPAPTPTHVEKGDKGNKDSYRQKDT